MRLSDLKIGYKGVAKFEIHGFKAVLDVQIIDIYDGMCNVLPLDSSVLEDMSISETTKHFTNVPLSIFHIKKYSDNDSVRVLSKDTAIELILEIFDAENEMICDINVLFKDVIEDHSEITKKELKENKARNRKNLEESTMIQEGYHLMVIYTDSSINEFMIFDDENGLDLERLN